MNFFSALEASRDYIHVQMTAKPRPYVHFISQTETILQAVSSIQTNNGAKITVLARMFTMVMRVVEFSSGGYKIRKISA